MKRCSQCEFTFDDEQEFCDFDNTELVPVTQPPPIRMSRSRRLAQSPFPLALVMIAAVLASALVIGYYESADQSNVSVSSNTESRSSGATQIPPVQVDTRAQAMTPLERPTTITTQRRISTAQRSAAIPGSMIRWPSEKSHSRSSRSGHGPSNAQLAATNTRHRKANSSLVTGNQKRLGSPGLVQQRHSIASNGVRNNTESMHHAKDSKLVAFLKTTGRLLKRPFGF